MIALDIGNKNIHIIEGAYKEGEFDIIKAVTTPTPSRCVVDGVIEDYKLLQDTLKQCIFENNIKTKKAVVTVNSTAVINKEIILPSVEPSKLTKMVTYEMEQSVPATAKEHVIEFKIVNTYQEKGQTKNRIRVAAMPESIVNQYYELLKGLKLIPVALDIHNNAVSKVFSSKTIINGQMYSTDKTVAIIDLGYKTTNIQVVSKGLLDYSRQIVYGLKDIDTTLIGYYRVSQDEVDKIKASKLDLNQEGLGLGLEENVYHPIKEALTQWMTEIQKVFQYYSSRLAENNIHEIYIHGGGTKIQGMVEYMKQALGHDALNKLESLGSIAENKEKAVIRFGDYINALGATIRWE